VSATTFLFNVSYVEKGKILDEATGNVDLEMDEWIK
jgi:hypothetical protein